MERLQLDIPDAITKSSVQRDALGRAIPGSQLSVKTQFKPGNVGNPIGRKWPAHEIRKQAQDNAATAIGSLIDIISDPKRHVSFKLQACEILLELGFGKADVATLVKFEVDTILSRLGLPKRSQLRDSNGERLFTSHGGYIPSQQADKAINSQPLDESQYANEVFRRLFPRVHIGNADYRQQARKAIRQQAAECQHLELELVELATCFRRLQDHYEQEQAILEEMVAELARMPPDD